MLPQITALLLLIATAAPPTVTQERETRRPRRTYTSADYKRVPVSYAAAVDRRGNALHDGELIEIEATSNTASDSFYKDKTKIYVQDGNAGIAVFGRKLDPKILPGEVVRVRGRVKAYAGMAEIAFHQITPLRRSAPVTPVEVEPKELLSRRYSGRLVRTRARVLAVYVRAAGTDVVLDAGEDRLFLHLSSHQKLLFPIDRRQTGALIEITGVSSPFERNPGELRWQILPRTPADIRTIKSAPLFSRTELRTLLYVAGGLLLIAVVWVALLGLQVRRKTREHQEVAERLQLLGHTIESTHDLITVTNLEERITFVNAAFLKAYGYKQSEIVGQHVSIFDSPNNPPELRAEISTAAAKDGWRGELLNRRADGSEFPIALSTSVVRDDDGRPIGLVGVARDITEERRIQDQLLASESRYRLLFERNPLPTWVYEVDSRHIVDVNDAALHRYGFMRDEMLQMTVDDLIAGSSNPVGIPQRDADEHLELARHRLKNGQEIYVELTEHTLAVHGKSLRLLVANDVTERRLAQEQIEYQAFHDGLTTLPNRRLFLDRLSMQTALAVRSGNSPVVMFIDLDRFKRINDTLGHWVGDELLKQVAKRLKAALRHSDSVARIGGDEFAILLAQEDRPTAETILALANKIINEFSKPFTIGEHELWVTASIGVAAYPEDGTDADTLLRAADLAMYRAKDSGRNNYQLAGGMAESKQAIDRLALEHDLHQALDRDEFRLLYQPQIDIASGRVMGVEALLRWQHPSRGLLYPRDFLAVAEESPLMIAIGDWVIHSACAQLRRWNDEGIDLKIAVNLSARQFERGHVPELVAGSLARFGVDARQLELEITERLAMQDVDKSSQLLRSVKQLGVRIAMDDFGTGYSSLSYLKYFPIDTVKIDQTFVRDITVDTSDAAIVSAVIAMAHTLKLRVIAEGVETDAQLQFLREHRCDAFQGFLVSPAVEPGELAELVRARSTPAGML